MVHGMEQQMQLMQGQMQAMMTEIQRLSAENAEFRRQTAAASSSSGVQQDLVEAIGKMAEKIGSIAKPKESLMDVRGLGKPSVFNNKADGWAKWSRSLENYVIGVFGDDFRQLLEHAAESDSVVEKKEIDETFGELADDVDQIEEVHRKCGQLYLALVALTEDDSQDIVTGAGRAMARRRGGS